MAFTTWAALYTKMKDDLASGGWKHASYAIEGRNVTYRSFDDFMKAYTFVEQKANEESGTPTPKRVGASNGWGRWA